MSKTHIKIEVRMIPEQIEDARANLMEMHPDMVDQIREMSMQELVRLAWSDLISASGFPAENVQVKKADE